jgi:small conductance mechanosensitive channel
MDPDQYEFTKNFQALDMVSQLRESLNGELLINGLQAAVILLVAWSVAKALRRAVRKAGRLRRVNPDILILLEQASVGTLYSVAAVMALKELGFDITTLVAGLGLTGFALGFALKDIISNFLCGIMILIFEPFKRNDQIKIDAFEGTVIKIDFRYTTLQLADRRVLVPNSNLFTKELVILDRVARPAAALVAEMRGPAQPPAPHFATASLAQTPQPRTR